MEDITITKDELAIFVSAMIESKLPNLAVSMVSAILKISEDESKKWIADNCYP